MFLTVFGLIYTLDFVELVRRTGDVADVPTALLAQLALFRTPAIAEQILPFAVLFGSMAALLNLSRKLELVVARAAGVSAWQFLTPAVLVALGIGIFTVTVYNPVASRLKDRATQVETIKLGRSKNSGEQQFWVRQRSTDGQAIIRAERSSASGSSLGSVTFFEFDKEGRFQSRVEGETAELRQGFWELQKVRLITPEQEPQTFASYVIATNLTPEQVRQSLSAADSVPFWELPSLVERTERAGLDATRYRLAISVAFGAPDAVCGDGVRGRFCFLKIFQIWWCGADGSRWCRFGLCALRRDTLGRGSRRGRNPVDDDRGVVPCGHRKFARNTRSVVSGGWVMTGRAYLRPAWFGHG